MKTKSSMLWCSLFSSASKYNISIRPSRYKRVAYGLLPCGACLIILVSFSYAYVMALVLIISSLISISVYISFENKTPFTYYLTISTQGLLTIKNEGMTYQLLATSRLSFIGCWLVFRPSPPLNPSSKVASQPMPTQLFIFRDSLSEQDYSRLVSVLKQLG